jgi:formylglycine-generating enzyme required for sulfatase activity
MRSDRASLPLFRATADVDREVADLAARALAEVGEAVRALVAEALAGEERQLWRAAIRYLGTQSDDLLWAQIPARVWDGVLGQSMVWVPPGRFLMGSAKSKDPNAWNDELPQHQVTLPGYWIGKYLVTVAQFRAFVKESGYDLRRRSGLERPEYHPMTFIDWHDAMAYCRWLAERSGMPVTLPSEAQWEKAARGADGRIFPWGNRWEAGLCNSQESGIGNTTPVGRYSPEGNSPYGCTDMAGNVWEWTNSRWMPYPSGCTEMAGDPEEWTSDQPKSYSLDGTGAQVLRGGAFGDAMWKVRCAFRRWCFRYLRGDFLGFRVCIVAQQE